MIIQSLMNMMDELHQNVHEHETYQRERMRHVRSLDELPNFVEGYYVLVDSEEFFEGEKLCLRWCGPRRITKELRDYVCKVEDLRNGKFDEIHGTRLKFYSAASIDEKVILSHVFSSETGMHVSRLLLLHEENGNLFVVVRWKGLSASDDTLEPPQGVYEDVPKLPLQMLAKASSVIFVTKRTLHSIFDRGVYNDSSLTIAACEIYCLSVFHSSLS